MTLPLPAGQFEVAVEYLNDRRTRHIVLRRFYEIFGHLPIDLSEKLRPVEWSDSVGVVQGEAHLGSLLVAHTPIEQYGEFPYLDVFRDIQGFRGVSLIIEGDGYKYGHTALRKVIQKVGYGDYLWGTSVDQLNNMPFWRRHAVTLLHNSEKHESLFMLPLTKAATARVLEYKAH